MNEHLDRFEVFPWNDNFETGIPVIDEQHRTLVDLLNTLTGTLVSGDNVELERVFDELAAYAAYHFESEETVWAPCFGDDDAWLAEHHETHASFLPAVVKLKEQYADKPLRETLEHIVKFLIRWLAHHIIDSDKRMAIVVKHVVAGLPLDEAKAKSAEDMSGSARLLIDTVLVMYDGLSSRTLDLMRERVERQKVEEQLREANRELEKRAVTDQLTGLFNRRHFDAVFEQELRRARRDKRELAFLMFDIDHFKKLNDTYGHLKGDQALKLVGTTLADMCRRPGDFAFRLGGEEFGVLVADQSTEGVDLFAERIRLAMADLAIPNEGSDVAPHMTVSLGLVSSRPGQDDSMDTFIKAADDRLYQAKSQGRNRVVGSSLVPLPPGPDEKRTAP